MKFPQVAKGYSCSVPFWSFKSLPLEIICSCYVFNSFENPAIYLCIKNPYAQKRSVEGNVWNLDLLIWSLNLDLDDSNNSKISIWLIISWKPNMCSLNTSMNLQNGCICFLFQTVMQHPVRNWFSPIVCKDKKHKCTWICDFNQSRV